MQRKVIDSQWHAMVCRLSLQRYARQSPIDNSPGSVQISVRTEKSLWLTFRTDLRQNLARYLDEVVDNRVPLTVTRQGGKGNVVMISEAEFNGWQETVHLLGNPANARRLLRSIRAADAGKTSEHELINPKLPSEA